MNNELIFNANPLVKMFNTTTNYILNIPAEKSHLLIYHLVINRFCLLLHQIYSFKTTDFNGDIKLVVSQLQISWFLFSYLRAFQRELVSCEITSVNK